jgi:phospholipid-translocating ATPase
VRSTFLRGFGATWSWWLCLIVILAATIVFELGTQSLRAAYFSTDVDVFQALEKDPEVKKRFEEAAAGELQAGWERATNKEKEEEVRVEEAEERNQERREREVNELLRKRGDGERREEVVDLDGVQVDRVLSRGFGEVRNG